MDINTALIALIAVLVVLLHFGKRDCREEIRAEVFQARREEIGRSQENIKTAFAVWMQAAQLGRQAAQSENRANDEQA